MNCSQSPYQQLISIVYVENLQEQYLHYLRTDDLLSLDDKTKLKKGQQVLSISQPNEQNWIQLQYTPQEVKNQPNKAYFGFELAQQQIAQIISEQQFNYDRKEICLKKSQKYIQNEKSLQKSSISQPQTNQRQFISTEFFCAIGLLRSNWFYDQGRLSCYSYGTGFLLSERLILTCAHNLCDQSNLKYATEVIFIPNWDGHIQSNTPQYKSAEGKYYRHKPLQHKVQTFSIIPLISELCLVVLKEPIKSAAYIKIGEVQVSEGQEIQICGFPNKFYNSLIKLSLVQLKRTTLKGSLIYVEEDIINHNLPTQVGHSGSPILTKDSNGNTVAIGVHSHRGQLNINRGLFFNSEIISYLKNFQSELTISYSLSSPIIYQKELDSSKGCCFVPYCEIEQKKIRELAIKQKAKQFVKYSAISLEKEMLSNQKDVSSKQLSLLSEQKVSIDSNLELQFGKSQEQSINQSKDIDQNSTNSDIEINLSQVKYDLDQSSLYSSETSIADSKYLDFLSQDQLNISTEWKILQTKPISKIIDPWDYFCQESIQSVDPQIEDSQDINNQYESLMINQNNLQMECSQSQSKIQKE